MIKTLFLAILLSPLSLGLAESSIDMEIEVLPDYGFVQTTGLKKTFPIIHQGSQCKYLIPVSVYSRDGSGWGIKVSAPPLKSADGKDTLKPYLVNYKIYGGVGMAIPPENSNVWEPLPTVPTMVYMADESEYVTDETIIYIYVFVNPTSSQTQKSYKTDVTIELVEK